MPDCLIQQGSVAALATDESRWTVREEGEARAIVVGIEGDPDVDCDNKTITLMAMVMMMPRMTMNMLRLCWPWW